MLRKDDPVHKICDLISDQDSFKLKADIQELTNRYAPMVRDVLIVVTNPDTPEQVVNVMTDEIQFQVRSMMDRIDARKLETVENFPPLLLAFQDLDLLVPNPIN